MSFRAFTSVRARTRAVPFSASSLRLARNASTTGPKSPASHKVSGEEGLFSVREMFELKNKNFVVTGGGRGIGYAVTRAIAEMGGNVAVLDVLDSPVKDWETLPQHVGREIRLEYIKADVTQEVSLMHAFTRAKEALGTIDGCVTAAGISLDKPFEDQTWGEVARVQDINILGTFFSTQLAVKQMREQGSGGSIVMIASVCAHVAAPGHRLSAYHASKGAVKMLSVGLSVELAPDQIRCNTISPGYIDTPMTEALREQYPHLVKIMEKAPPMRRIGNRNDLTGAVIYLLSDASKYTTGADILITGGLHAGRIEYGDE